MHARRKKLVDEIRISRCIFFSSQFDENDVDGAKNLVVQIAESRLFELTEGTISSYNCNSYT